MSQGAQLSPMSQPRRTTGAAATDKPKTLFHREEPSVAELLAIDLEFRQKERAGQLPRVAPLRFNPDGEAWLPILHTRRDERKYTAMFSNTPLANEQHTTHDWVIIVREGRNATGQWTVVTERSGALEGRRVIRGRESECKAHYAAHADHQPALF